MGEECRGAGHRGEAGGGAEMPQVRRCSTEGLHCEGRARIATNW